MTARRAGFTYVLELSKTGSGRNERTEAGGVPLDEALPER